MHNPLTTTGWNATELLVKDPDRTVTHVVNLQEPARVEELAQMLGTHGTTAEQGAIEILEQSQLLKRA